MEKIFAPGNDPLLTSLGLLVLRLFFGLTMLLHHGLAKLEKFNTLNSDFPDPLGVGHKVSLALTVFTEVVGATLLAAGLVTRFAALVLAFEMAVAFVAVHKMTLGGPGPGEFALVYFGAFLTLLFADGGRFSVDKLLFGKASNC